MVALVREGTFLKHRHGKDILIGDQLWPRCEIRNFVWRAFCGISPHRATTPYRFVANPSSP